MATDATKQTPKVADDAQYVDSLSFSGNNNSTSSILVSGGPTETSSYVSGLYEVFTQRATITYKRVPDLQMQAQVVSLSAEPQINATIPYTRLRAKVELVCERQYVTGVYSTSSYTEGQRFRVLAQNVDQFGNTYGDLSAGGSYTLGPQGTIVTEIPFYQRTLIDQAQATLATGVSSLQQYNVGFKTAHYVVDGQASAAPASWFFHDSKTCTRPAQACGFDEANGPTEFLQGPTYSIVGGYQTQLEDDAQLIQFVDTLCQRAAYGRLYDEVPALLHPGDPTRSELATTVDPALPSYWVGRHDWS